MMDIYPSFTKKDIGTEKFNNLHKVLQCVSGKAETKPKCWNCGTGVHSSVPMSFSSLKIHKLLNYREGGGVFFMNANNGGLI